MIVSPDQVLAIHGRLLLDDVLVRRGPVSAFVALGKRSGRNFRRRGPDARGQLAWDVILTRNKEETGRIAWDSQIYSQLITLTTMDIIRKKSKKDLSKFPRSNYYWRPAQPWNFSEAAGKLSSRRPIRRGFTSAGSRRTLICCCAQSDCSVTAG